MPNLIFKPNIIRGIGYDKGGIRIVKPEIDFNLTGAFKYDIVGIGLKSTQQLNIDFSNFKNHTFFNSAQIKTTTAFSKILNQIPFDGNKSEYELFINNLNGFEKYIFDNMPKNIGFMYFSGSDNYIIVNDSKGTADKTSSRNITGNRVLNPSGSSMTIEFNLFIQTGSISNSYLLQKLSNNQDQGFSIYLSGSDSGDPNGYVKFEINSGSLSSSTDYVNISKGSWNHLAFNWNNGITNQILYSYLNQNLYLSKSIIPFGLLNIDGTKLYIGSGSNINNGFTQDSTFQGGIDELRLWHKNIEVRELKENANKNIFSEDDLKLYFKFNEPSNTNIILDYSGNSLHGLISGSRNFSTGSLTTENALAYEQLSFNPILFPDNSYLLEFQDLLLEDAILYDNQNPSLITKLFPPHLFSEGQYKDALEFEYGNKTDGITGNSFYNANSGETQVLLGLLWIWASMFDEIKIYMDAFSNLVNIDYSNEDNIPNIFLKYLGNKLGIELPNLFTNATLEQFLDGEKLKNENYFISSYSLQQIKNELWRRILINSKNIINSKGTIGSVKSFLRSVGIDPDSNITIKEYGNNLFTKIINSRETKTKILKSLNFNSGGLIVSPYLSSSRIEPGIPLISNNGSNDGMWTSGSWTYESLYKLNSDLYNSQSLVRFQTKNINNENNIIANLIALSGSGVDLYINPQDNSSNYLKLSLRGFDPFNKNIFYTSFGRIKNEKTGSIVSSSYFLNVGYQSSGEISNFYSTSSWYYEGNDDLFSFKNSSNTSGSFIIIGSSSYDITSSAFLNSVQNYNNFNGKVSNIRFWSKDLTNNEIQEHIKNPFSLGVKDPTLNFNFNTNRSGSFERLRIDVSCDQEVTSSNGSGLALINDYSQNNNHFSGSNFTISSDNIFSYETIFYSQLSTNIEQGSSTNKVRIRSFEKPDEEYNGLLYSTAPVYSLNHSEEIIENSKLGIDFSITKALNEDIIKILGSLEQFNDYIGKPEYMYSNSYPDLDKIKEIYFNRLISDLNLRSFYDFFSWFDSNLTTFIEQLLPKRTRYLGTNYVIESHLLERFKYCYEAQADQYFDERIKTKNNDIKVQFFEGTIRKI